MSINHSRFQNGLGCIALSMSFLVLAGCTNQAAEPSVASAAPVVAAAAPAPASGLGSDPAYPEIDIPPVWSPEGHLIQPKDFREMVFIGAPLTPHGLNDGKSNFPEFHNVYVQPAAFKAYRETGKWPEGTMMIKELQLVDDPKGDFPDGSRVLPSGRGYFPGAVNGLDVSVKDSKRFADTNNWGYFNFNHAPPRILRKQPSSRLVSALVATSPTPTKTWSTSNSTNRSSPRYLCLSLRTDMHRPCEEGCYGLPSSREGERAGTKWGRVA